MTTKYRSKVRDEPRILRAISFSKTRNLQPRPQSGIFSYSPKSAAFTRIFDSSSKANQRRIKSKFGVDVARVHEFIDLQYCLASEYAWLFDSPAGARINEVNKVLFGSFHKGLIALTTSVDLTSRGLIGPARPLLRWVFEACLIAKYCSSHPSADVFDRWVDGHDISLTFAVLKKLNKPNPNEFSKLWKLLCQYTHSSVYAMQVDMNEKVTDEEVGFNMVITDLLLAWLYHLLNRHIITSSMEYYQCRYRDQEVARNLRVKARALMGDAREQFEKPTNQLFKDFCVSWKTNDAIS